MKLPAKLWFVLTIWMAAIAPVSFAQTPATNAIANPDTAAPSPDEIESRLSPATLEIVRMFDSGVEESVLSAYVKNSTNPFNLDADAIIYLRDIGMYEKLTTEMLQRDEVLRQSPAPVAAPVPAAVAPEPPMDQTPRPQQAPQILPQSAQAPLPPPSTAAYVSDAPENVRYFYDGLAPYGTWLQVADLGWGWQPGVAAANPEWRPYVDGGRWLWTDRGWYWSSDYSWGWAPFHYGRWQLIQQLGWTWFPDTVWAPSWVSFRYDDDHFGWAPLPQSTYYQTVYVQPVEHFYTFVSFDFVFNRHL